MFTVYGENSVKSLAGFLLALSNLICFWKIFGFLLGNFRLSLDISGNLGGKKMHFYLSVNVFTTKVLIGDTIFYVS